MGVVANLTVRVNASTAGFDKELAGLDKALNRFGGKLQSVGADLTKGITLPLAAIGGFALKAAIDFESSFAGVKKTVNATDAEFAKLAQGMRDMAKTMPVNVNELNKIGEAAGQLGIPQEHILEFTRVMAQLGVTTNLTSDQAATSIAQIQNIFNESGKNTANFASALVALGNAGASTEQDIVALAARLAGAGNQIGLSQAETLGFAAALANLGINAEAGGSALSRVMSQISVAVDMGGEKLADFASVAGLSATAFAELFSVNPSEAIARFVDGLGQVKESGGNVTRVLNDLSLNDVRVQDALKRMAGAGDELRTSLDLSKKSWVDNTALTTEFGKRAETTESQMTTLWNRANDVAITFGEQLKPSLMGLLDALKPVLDDTAKAVKWFSELPDPVKRATIEVFAFGALLGPVAWGIGNIVKVGAGLLTLFNAIGASKVFQYLLGGGVSTKGPMGPTGPFPGLEGLAGALKGGGFAIGNSAAMRNDMKEAQEILEAYEKIELPTPRGRDIQLFPGGLPRIDPNATASLTGFAAGGVVDLNAFKQAANAAKPAAEGLKKALTLDATTVAQYRFVRQEIDAIGISIPNLTGKTSAWRDEVYNLSSSVLPDLKLNLNDVGQAASASLDDATQATLSFKDSLVGVLQNLPETLGSAFEGGGNLLGAFKSLGVQLADAIVTPIIAKLSKAAKAAMSVGGAIASGVGGAVGGGAGATIGGLAGSIGGAAVAGSLGAATAATVGGMVAIGAATAGIGLAAIGAYYGLKKLFFDSEKKVNPLRDAFQSLTFGSLPAMNQAFATVGLTTDRVLNAKKVEDFQAAVDEYTAKLAFQNQAMDTLRQTAEKYGFTLEQLGPALQRQMLSEQAAGLYQDFEVLRAGGIDTALVIEKMSGSVNEFVLSALRTGTEIPAAMKPMLQSFIDQGTLFDANGQKITSLEGSGLKFSESMTEGFQKVVDAVTLLTEAIALKLGIALDQLPGRAKKAADGVNGAFAGMPGQPVYGRKEPGGPTVPAGLASGGWVTSTGVQHFAGGGHVFDRQMFRSRGTDTVPAMLTPGEMVLNAAQQEGVASELGGGDVNFYITGPVYADRDHFRNMVRSVLRDGAMQQEIDVAVRRRKAS